MFGVFPPQEQKKKQKHLRLNLCKNLLHSICHNQLEEVCEEKTFCTGRHRQSQTVATHAALPLCSSTYAFGWHLEWDLS